MKKSKRSLKGMTLIEMIISIAIFAVMCGVLIGVGAHGDRTTKSTTKFKDKIVQESHYASARIKTYDAKDGSVKDLTSNTAQIDIKLSGTYSWYDKKADGTPDPTKKNTQTDPSVKYETSVYSTEDVVTDDFDTADELDAYRAAPNSGLNFKFLDTDPVDGTLTEVP